MPSGLGVPGGVGGVGVGRAPGEHQREHDDGERDDRPEPEGPLQPPDHRGGFARPALGQRRGAAGEDRDRDRGADGAGDLLGGAEQGGAVGVQVHRERAQAEGEDRGEDAGQRDHQQHVDADDGGDRGGLADQRQGNKVEVGVYELDV